MHLHNYQTALLPIKMLSDSVLPADICPAAVMPIISEPRNVLLTGATGFLVRRHVASGSEPVKMLVVVSVAGGPAIRG